MRPVGRALIIRPDGGSGKHVFVGEAERLQEMHDIPDEHVIVFDHDDTRPERYDTTCAGIERASGDLSPGEKWDSLIILRHGLPLAGQEGSNTQNLGRMVRAARGRWAPHLTVALLSCSNAATIGRNPDGDMSFADVFRDELCRAGFVWCQVYGHLIAGHATRLLTDRQGGAWRPLARWFRGDGSAAGGIGGEVVMPRGHALLDDAYRLMRRSVDLDDDGPEPMTGFRFLVPWMESQAEFIAYVQRFADVRAETGASDGPTVLELQTALARGGFDPGPLDGLAGRRTTSAVKAFQRAHPPLAVDGDAGPATWRQMRAAGLLA